jgi:hypothetical protein
MVHNLGSKILSSIGLLALLSVAVVAQSEIPPVPAMIVLEYKFQPGEVLSYQFSGGGKGTMQVSGLDTSFNTDMVTNGTMPLTLDLLGYITMSTKQVYPDRSAELDLTFDNFVEKINMMNQKIALKISKGKVQMEMNGQQTFASDSNSSYPFFGKPISYKMSKSGKIEEFSGFEWMKQMMPSLANSMDFNQVLKQMQPVFPEHPIKIGDSWASTTKFNLSQAKKELANFVINSRYIGNEKVNGKRCAVIQYTGTFDLANWKLDFSDTTDNQGLSMGMNFKNMRQTLAGKSYHTLDAGQIAKCEFQQQFSMELSMNMPMPDPKTKQLSEMTMKLDLAMNMVMELK